MKKLLTLISLIFFTAAQAQTTTPAPQQNFTYGLKTNVAYIRTIASNQPQGANYYMGADFSFYTQYKAVGVFFGCSVVHSLTNLGDYYDFKKNLACFNAGFQFRLFQSANKKHSLMLDVYDVHYKHINPKYDPNDLYNYPNYRKQGTNFIYFNPRYRNTFCKGILSFEAGLYIGYSICDEKTDYPNYKTLHFFKYQNTLYPNLMLGANVGLSLNVNAFFVKK